MMFASGTEGGDGRRVVAAPGAYHFQVRLRPLCLADWCDVPSVNNSANGYCLPNEKEWEFAARGGVATNGCAYSGSNTVDEVAWYSVNSGNEVHEVATKQANELRLTDMSGNVWEWCFDVYLGADRAG